MNLIHPDYLEKITEIEDKIDKYEEASQYMRDVEYQLQQLNIRGFDEDIQNIRNHLNDLQSYEKVKELMKHLRIDIDNYRIDYNLFQKELNKLSSKVIDKEKRMDIQLMLASPRSIDQGKALIKSAQSHMDKRDRLCFPQELTQYTDEYLIGTGGFSRVYKARNIEKNHIVAVKIPIKNDASIGKSFLRELNNWVSLDHINIVKIYQYNIFPIPYIEMEWCDSCLDDIEKPVQFNLATHYILGIAEGLEYAHKKNIAHFDLKPQNILLKNDIPKITDWGLSRLLTMQKTTTIGISLPFAAPEQFSTHYGKRDSRTDIWQLGILYYYLLTNDIPFSGTDFAEYAKDVTTKNIKKMISVDPTLQDVKHILTKCLAKHKKDRYDSVTCFLKDIKQIM